jgi:hypothetical protein
VTVESEKPLLPAQSEQTDHKFFSLNSLQPLIEEGEEKRLGLFRGMENAIEGLSILNEHVGSNGKEKGAT